MDTTLVAAILAAVATLVGAWIGISRQTKKKTDERLKAYRILGEKIYQVRYHGATIRELLGNDPGPYFAQDIVSATKSFRDACDSLQSVVGANRWLISKNMYDGVADLIEASANLIESLKQGMSGAITPDQIVRELTDLGRVFQDRLRMVEELMRKEENKL